MASSVKLYGMPFSTCATRAMICLKEKEVEYEFIPVNLFAGENKQPDFLSKNPFGKIPVLEDGDITLFESRAITSFVAEKYNTQGCDLLHQTNLNESAQVKQWCEVEAHQYNPAIQPIVFQVFVIPMKGGITDQEAVDRYIVDFSKVLDIYEARLSTTKYLAGDFYSLADLHHLSYTFYFMNTKYAHLINDRPHVKAWWEDISSRPAFVKVAENMKIGGVK